MATFGEQAVGLDFNPSGNETVTKLKTLYAEIIDILVPDGDLDNGATGLKGRILGRAINDAIVAQMLAVKAVTFPDLAPAATSTLSTEPEPTASSSDGDLAPNTPSANPNVVITDVVPPATPPPVAANPPEPETPAEDAGEPSEEQPAA